MLRLFPRADRAGDPSAALLGACSSLDDVKAWLLDRHHCRGWLGGSSGEAKTNVPPPPTAGTSPRRRPSRRRPQRSLRATRSRSRCLADTGSREADRIPRPANTPDLQTQARTESAASRNSRRVDRRPRPHAALGRRAARRYREAERRRRRQPRRPLSPPTRRQRRTGNPLTEVLALRRPAIDGFESRATL